MKLRSLWARLWLPYCEAGVFWVTFGAVVLSDPQQQGLIFVGLACLGFGIYGVGWRVMHGYGPIRPLPSRFFSSR
jgi:hypothetical protein